MAWPAPLFRPLPKTGRTGFRRPAGSGMSGSADEGDAGRGSRARTRDLRFWRPPLYQLSYTPAPSARRLPISSWRAVQVHIRGWRRFRARFRRRIAAPAECRRSSPVREIRRTARRGRDSPDRRGIRSRDRAAARGTGPSRPERSPPATGPPPATKPQERPPQRRPRISSPAAHPCPIMAERRANAKRAAEAARSQEKKFSFIL